MIVRDLGLLESLRLYRWRGWRGELLGGLYDQHAMCGEHKAVTLEHEGIENTSPQTAHEDQISSLGADTRGSLS